MGYYSDKKFSTYTDNINLIIDGCGNSYEDKYYVNGMYIDLCGLPIEEYMSNPCCCGGGSNNDEDNDKTKKLNNITITTYKDEQGVIFYMARANYTVTSDLKVTVLTTDNETLILEIPIGKTESMPVESKNMSFIDVALNNYEDETYKYKVIAESELMEYNIYNKTMLLKEKHFDFSKYNKISVEAESETNIKYIIPSTSIDYNNFETEEEINNFFQENQYCFILSIPESVYMNNEYEIKNSIGHIITNKFTFEQKIIYQNVNYVILIEKATDDINPYVPLYNEDLNYDYKLILEK